MKAGLIVLSALAAFGAGSPGPNDERVARGLELVKKQEQCKSCIDNCARVGGLGEAACKVIICAIECVITDA